MLSSHRVIKHVGREMEQLPVRPRIWFAKDSIQEYYPSPEVVQEADDIVKNARVEAARLMIETEERIKFLEGEAYARGFKKGEDDFWESGRQSQEKFRQSTREVLQQMLQIREKMYLETEQELLELAVKIAQKMVCKQLEINPETNVDIVKTACSQARECEIVIVYVEPQQLDTVRARREEIAALLHWTKKLEFVADATIESGGCRIETELGYIDATIANMLEQLSTMIKEHGK